MTAPQATPPNRATAASKPSPYHPGVTTVSVRFAFFPICRPESASVARVLPTVPARDCWIYIFKDAGDSVFWVCEIFVTDAAGYRLVDLQGHHDKDVRPLLDGEEDSIYLTEGHKMPSGAIQPLDYWALVSPFQLPARRLFDLGPEGLAKGSRASDFRKWARTRQLESFKVTREAAKDGVDDNRVIALNNPWFELVGLNGVYQHALAAYHETFTTNVFKIRRRLLARTTLGLQEAVALANYIDVDALKKEIADDDKEMATRAEARDHAASALVSALDSPRAVEMFQDAADSADPEVLPLAYQIWSQAHEGLNASEIGFRYMVRFYKKNHDVVHKKHKYAKVARKEIKSYWSFVKAFVSHAEYHEPGSMVGVVQEVTKRRFEVDLKLEEGLRLNKNDNVGDVLREIDKAAAGEPSKVMKLKLGATRGKWFTSDSINELKRRTTEHVEVGGIFAVIDALNFGAALFDLIDAEHGEVAGKRVALAGATASMLSSLSTPFEVVSAAKMAARKEAAKGFFYKEAMTSVGGRLAKGALGAIAGVADVYAGFTAAEKDVSHGDTNAANISYLQMTGGLLAVAGAIIGGILVTASLGPILAAAGGLLAFGSTVLLPFVKDDPLEAWLKQSPWRKDKRIAEASLSGQIEGLSDVFYALHAACEVIWDNPVPEAGPGSFAGPGIAVTPRLVCQGVRVSVTFRLLDEGTSLLLGVEDQHGHTLRPFSPGRAGTTTGGAFSYAELLPPSDSLKKVRLSDSWAKLKVTLQLQKPDGTLWPEKPKVLTFPVLGEVL